MRVAIVGAGLAGLACAHELERLHHQCEIFDKRDRIGKMFNTVETMLEALIMDPQKDVFDLLRQDCNLPVNPSSHITRLVLHTRSHEALLRGRMGYTTIRGSDPRSLEQQLARHIRSPIHLDQNPDVEKLKSQYDWVVVATGSPKWPKHFGLWTRDIGWYVRGANVIGDFNPGELHFLFNTRYAGTGYAMLSPFDERYASTGIGVPDSSEEELEAYWEVFCREHSRYWERIEDEFKLECYEMGRVRQRVLENILFVGNAGGFIEPLGITGQVDSLRSGVYAARKIAQGDTAFDEFARRWDQYYERLWRLRLNVNAWTDDDMDRLAAFAGHGIGTVLSHAPVNLLDLAGRLMPFLPLAQDPSAEVGRQ
jgi:digeranylgeranylglycerophospholipid reductase